MAPFSSPPTSVRRSSSSARAARIASLGLLALSWPVAASARTPTHVACVGDSITYGYGASSTNASYPADLQKMFGSSVMVKNFGHSGATLLSVGDLPYQMQSEYTAATTFVSGAGANAAVAVVIMLGTNDAKPQNWMSGARATQMRTDAAALIDHFAQLGTHPTVYLALPPRAYPNSFGIDGTVLHEQIEPLLKQVAASKSVATIDMYTPTANDMTLLSSDKVHPTDAGYMLLATIVHDALLTDAGGGGGAGGGMAGASGGRGGGSAGSGGANAGGRGGGAAGGATGNGGNSIGGTGGSTSSGGTSSGGTAGAASGGVGTGGSATGGVGSGGVGSGGAATGGGFAATGGSGTGGTRAGSGGQSPTASGGAMSSSSGGSGGGAATTATGGSASGGGETNASPDGCSCAFGGRDDGRWTGGAGILFLVCFLARARRRRA